MQWGHLPLAGDAQRDEEEPRNYLQRMTLTPPSTGITAPVI
jgi:hypothetical protein